MPTRERSCRQYQRNTRTQCDDTIRRQINRRRRQTSCVTFHVFDGVYFRARNSCGRTTRRNNLPNLLTKMSRYYYIHIYDYFTLNFTSEMPKRVVKLKGREKKNNNRQYYSTCTFKCLINFRPRARINLDIFNKPRTLLSLCNVHKYIYIFFSTRLADEEYIASDRWWIAWNVREGHISRSLFRNVGGNGVGMIRAIHKYRTVRSIIIKRHYVLSDEMGEHNVLYCYTIVTVKTLLYFSFCFGDFFF